MSRQRRNLRLIKVSALAVLASGTVACSHVGQDQFDSTIAQVRREAREGDESLSRSIGSRIDGVDQRVDGVESRMTSLERDVNALAADFDVMVERMEVAMRFNTPIFFAFDDAALNAQDQEMLDRFTHIVRDYYPTAIVTVEGFTDAAGSPEYNMRLGQLRAESVKDYLVMSGQITPDRVRAVSYGEEMQRLIEPGVAGPGDDGWQNRRVVLVIDHSANSPGQVAASSY